MYVSGENQQGKNFWPASHGSELLLKTTVIQMLDYPRSLVRRNVELHDCPHAGQFADTDARCRFCDFTMECRWLCQNDEFVALGEKPIDRIVEALSFALGYVHAETTKWGHRPQNCRCEACTWLRSAHRLYDKVCGDPSISPAPTPDVLKTDRRP